MSTKKKKTNNKQNNKQSKQNTKQSNKQNMKKLKIASLIIDALFILIGTILAYTICRLNVLPTKFFLPVFLLLIGGIAFFSWCLWRPKLKYGVRFFLCIFISIISIMMLIGICYINRGLYFLSNITNANYQVDHYKVLVLKEKGYDELKDIEKKELGYLENMVNIEKALDILSQSVSCEKENYDKLEDLMNALLEEEIDAMLVSDAYQKILEENDKSLKDKVKVIYEFDIKTKVESISKQLDITKDTFHIYISGMDEYGSVASSSRSDVNIVATVNPQTHQVLLMSIPRDYYVQLHGTTGYKDKLTHAGIYGIDMSVKTLEDLLDIDINYYVKINFTTLIQSVDAIGGVNVYSKYSFTSKDGYVYTKGMNRMNGEQALSFARERKSLPGGDRDRGANQEAVIAAMIKKIAGPTIITKYDSILSSLEGTFLTNLSTKEITSLVKMQIDKMPTWNIHSIHLDGSDASEYTYTYSREKLYVMEPDMDTVVEAQNLIAKVKEGTILDNTLEESGPVHDTDKVIPEQTPNEPQIEVPKDETKDEIKEEPSTPSEEVTPPEEDLPKEDEEDSMEEPTIPPITDPPIEEPVVPGSPEEVEGDMESSNETVEKEE